MSFFGCSQVRGVTTLLKTHLARQAKTQQTQNLRFELDLNVVTIDEWLKELTEYRHYLTISTTYTASRCEYNTVRPHSACGGFPPAPEAIKPSPWFLRMPVLHGPPQVLGLT